MKIKNKISTKLKLKNKVYQFGHKYEFGITDGSKKDISLNSDLSLSLDDFIVDLKEGQKGFYQKLFGKDLMYKLKLNFKFYKDKNGDYRYRFKTGYDYIDPLTNELVKNNYMSYDFKTIETKRLENLNRLGYAVHWSFRDYLDMLYPDFIDDDTKICATAYFATLDHEIGRRSDKIIQFEDGYSKFVLDGEKHDLKDWIAEPYHNDIDFCYANDNPHDHIGLFIYFANYNKKHYIDNPRSCKFKPNSENRSCMFVLHKPNK